MKTEVTMLPNTSCPTMPPAAHPANDAEPRIAPASVRLRRLHAYVNRASIDAPARNGRAPEIIASDPMEGIGIALDVPGNRMFVTDLGLSEPDTVPQRRHRPRGALALAL
jgi:hypothetical protein